MAQVEFQGKDLGEAITQAAEALSLPPEKVKFSVITMGAKGFLGIGRRKARIAVDPDDPSVDIEGGKTKKPQARPEKKAGPTLPAKRKLTPERAAPNNRGPKNTGRTQAENDADEGETAIKPLPGGHNPATTDPTAAHGPDWAKENGTETKTEEIKPLSWEHLPPPLTCPAQGESEEPADQLAIEAAEVAREIISRMGFSAEIRASRLGNRILLLLESEDNAILIGGRGATLEALQLLTAKIMSKKSKAAGAENVRVVIDAADYRSRHQNSLLENLKNLAEQARRSKKPQIMSGLNSADRRLVQLALRPFKDLSATHSSGARDALVISTAQSCSRPRNRRKPHNAGRHHNK